MNPETGVTAMGIATGVVRETEPLGDHWFGSRGRYVRLIIKER